MGEIHVASNSLVAARIEVYAYAFTTLGYSLSLSLSLGSIPAVAKTIIITILSGADLGHCASPF